MPGAEAGWPLGVRVERAATGLRVWPAPLTASTSKKTVELEGKLFTMVEYRVPEMREAMAGVVGGFVGPYRVL